MVFLRIFVFLRVWDKWLIINGLWVCGGVFLRTFCSPWLQHFAQVAMEAEGVFCALVFCCVCGWGAVDIVCIDGYVG